MSTIQTTGTLSSMGIGSGLDVTSIVNKLVSIESQPLYDLQSAASGMKTKLSAVGQVTSYMSALRDAAAGLNNPGLWSGTTASSSDTAVTAVAADGATAASYNINVTSIAQSESAGSKAFASSSSTVGTGVMTISLGSWNADQTGFTAKDGATPVAITVEEGDTLANIRDKINGANAGVTASIVTDSSGARLSIRSTATGAENAFQITVNDGGDGVDTDDQGLSALAYDPANGTNGLARNQAASDAAATINGLAVTSASNTMSNVLDGLSLTLNKVTTAPVTVSVASNTQAIQTAVTAFTTAYNNAMSYLRTQTAYDATNKTAGTLQGDMTTVHLMTQLRNLVGSNSSASSVFTRFSDIGLNVQKDGSISIDQTKLGSALTNLPELRKVLAQPLADGAASTTSGMMQQIYAYANPMLQFDGALQSETDGINARITDNSDQQASMQDRINSYQARVQAQYQALDAQMAQLTGLSSYVSQQMAALAKQG